MKATDDTTQIVPFVPFRCPQCGRPKPFTSGVRGRLRYHTCRNCGCKYRSYEVEQEDAHQWFRAQDPPSSGS